MGAYPSGDPPLRNATSPQVRDVAAFGIKIDWTADEIDKAREVAQRPPAYLPRAMKRSIVISRFRDSSA
jgi:hypothetical protein